MQAIVGIPAVNVLLSIIAVGVIVNVMAFYSVVEQYGGKLHDSED